MPIRFRSRQVKCMLMSSPVASRTSRAVGSTAMRTRPSEPSLMSTMSTPALFQQLGALHQLLDGVAARRVELDGDDELTAASLCPARSAAWPRAVRATATAAGRLTRHRRAPGSPADPAPGGRAPRASRRCAAGVVPQQPPISRAPAATIRSAYSAM